MFTGPFTRHTFGILLASSMILGCGETITKTTTGGRISPTFQGPAELAYCSSSTTYSSPVTITGTAEFEYRDYFGTSGSGGLSTIFDGGARKPIRYAEVRVLDSAGNVDQCAETDANGDFSFTLPQNSGTYTIQVNSRALNSQARATVFNSPEFNDFYSLTTTVSSSSNRAIGTMVAEADGTVIAGAFNILDQIVEANIYLNTNVGPSTCGGIGCTEVSVAEKVSVYWQAGFNPGEYIDGSPLSYYIKGFRRLFILGGLNGDVDNTDTDHFDNTIILHEYGHFLEDVYFGSDTPGGPHNGNAIIDPRLAWSEAWSNLFQGVVRNTGNYLDTEGNADGSTDWLVFIGFESNSGVFLNDRPDDGFDNNKGYPVETHGEGNFREYSITRLLWDSVDTNNDGESITGGFSEMWTSLSNSSFGWNDSRWQFRSVGAFHKIHTDRAGATDWSGLHAIEKQVPNRLEYAQYVEPDNSCPDADYLMELTPGGSGSGSPSTDFYRDHDFFHLRLSSTTSGSISVEFTDIDGIPSKTDLDLYIYNSNARLFNSSDRVAFTIATNASSNASVAETDSAALNSVPAGNYLIDVFSFDGTGTPVEYGLKLNGVKLCRKDPP